MADADNKMPPAAQDAVDTRRKNIGLFIAAGAFFVIVFIILAFWAFSPSNTPMGNTRQQQMENR